jgi:long-chain acyl-CoA synthetase
MNYSTIPELLIYLSNKYNTSKPAFLYKKDGKYIGIDYSELRKQVEIFALGLLNLGIHVDDKIGIVSENRIEWIIADLAISCIGAVDVPIYPTLSAKQEEYIFNDSGCSAIIVSNKFQLKKVMEFKDSIASLRHIIIMNDELDIEDVTVKTMSYIMMRGAEIRSPEARRNIIEESIARIQPDDLLTIIYTSGTTGNPKGVMLTHKNIITNLIGIHDAIHFDEKDSFLSFLPFCHAYERTTGYYAAFSCGTTIAIAESIESVSANMLEVQPTVMTVVPRLLEIMKKKILANIEKQSILKQKIFNWAFSVGKKYIKAKIAKRSSLAFNFQYRMAYNLVFEKIHAKTGGKLRLFVSGGAPLPVDVDEFFLAAGYTLLEGYGLTEASPVVAAQRVDDIEIGTIGKRLFNIELKFAPDGEILIRSDSIMKGYWNDPISTQEAIDEDGWLYTGDIGSLTTRGNIKITDRKKHLFVNSGGKNIAPQPIENLLCQSTFIEQCILVGDRREYCTALITPDFDQLKILAENLGIKYNIESELISNPQIISTIKRDIDRLQKDLAKYEHVRKFSLLSQPFTIESGELTPKLSIKRHIVENNYSELIGNMY